MKIIGIMGGVGTGKTTVAKLLHEKYKSELILTDDVAKELMEKDNVCYKKVVDVFGNEILDDMQNIDRKKLAQIVFNDNEKLKILNICTHESVIEEVKNRINCKNNVTYDGKCDIIIIESALLVQSGLDKLCDEIYFVTTDLDIRRKRLKINRNYTDEKIDSMIKSQGDYERYRSICDRVIVNNGNQEELDKQLIINLF